MKIDVTQETKDHVFNFAIKTDQFKTLRDYETLHHLINAVSLDFDLDPEISVDDLKKIVAEAKAEESLEITCEIGPDGIDIEY